MNKKNPVHRKEFGWSVDSVAKRSEESRECSTTSKSSKSTEVCIDIVPSIGKPRCGNLMTNRIIGNEAEESVGVLQSDRRIRRNNLVQQVVDNEWVPGAGHGCEIFDFLVA